MVPTTKKNWSVNLNLEHIVVYRNSSNEFDIGHNTNCKVLYFSFAQVRKLWLRILNIVMRVRSYELMLIIFVYGFVNGFHRITK